MDRLNLSGQWTGDFAYPANQGPTTPFVATIEDRSSHLSGTISEHDLFSGAIIEAVLTGTRDGSSVDFTKTYGASASSEYDQPIDYVGSISSDGLVVTGVWSLLDWDGTFEMRRDAIVGEAEAARKGEEVTEPASVR